MIKRKIITGCEAFGTESDPLLTRWILLETKFGNLYLHKFHRSDSQFPKSREWGFWLRRKDPGAPTAWLKWTEYFTDKGCR